MSDFQSWGVRVVRGGVCNKTSPYYPNSLTPQPVNSLTLQIRKSEIFVKVFVCGAKRSAQKPLRSAHKNLHKNFGFTELRS